MARILAVEDDPDELSSLCEILRRAGHDVFEAKDGVEALRPMDETLEAARAAGVFRTVEKPFTHEQVLEAVNAAVVELDSGGGEPAGTHSNAAG